jgi:hypothetical protein
VKGFAREGDRLVNISPELRMQASSLIEEERRVVTAKYETEEIIG